MHSRSDIVRSIYPHHHVRYRAPCNLDCFYCYEKPHPSAAPEDTLTRIEDNLREAAQAGYRVAVFGAGELLMLANWGKAVQIATGLGFEQVWVLSNLVRVDESKLEQLVRAGVTGVVGTFFSLNDDDAREIAGRKQVFSRQQAAALLLSDRDDLQFGLHLMLSKPVMDKLLYSILKLRDGLSRRPNSMMLSAIEPVSQQHSAHSYYSHGLDHDWESTLQSADDEGLFLVVQNVPACILGRYAHRSLMLRKRVGRIIRAWPKSAQARDFVDRAESLSQRIEAKDRCARCSLLATCHRFFEYPVTREISDRNDLQVVQALIDEEGLSQQAGAIVTALRRIESPPEPAGRAL